MKMRWFLAIAAAVCVSVPTVQAQQVLEENDLPRDLHGLWWEVGQPGWAIAMFDHPNAMTSAHLIYDTEGRPTWAVSPLLDCFRNDPPGLGTRCEGALYRTKAPWFGAPSFRPADVTIERVGEWTGRWTVPLTGGTGPDLRRELFFGYTFDNQVVQASGLRTLQVQVIDPNGDFLWRDGRFSGLWGTPSEPGWGVAVFVQNKTLFATLLVHGPDKQPRWYVVNAYDTAFEERADRKFEGRVYETRGHPVESGLAGAADIQWVGLATLHFGEHPEDPATLEYSINGVRVTKTVSKQE